MTPEQLFTEHFEKFRSGIFRSSLDHYLETGKLSGSALLEVRAMFEAHDKQKLNKHDVMPSLRQADTWVFVATKNLPKEEGVYECLDRFGNIDKAIWANSGAPNEPTSFFNGKTIKAIDIIAWRNGA